MSLLLINSSNLISHSLIKTLRASTSLEKIVCADLYPGYFAYERWFKFKDQLEKEPQSKVQVTDIKFEEKSDLYNAIKKSSHVLYVTHDYYKLVPSKVTLLPNAVKLAKEIGVKKFVVVNPVEHFHYGEQNVYATHVKAEEEARNIFPDLLLLQSDLTFGPHATLISQLLKQISNSSPLHFSPSAASSSPIHTADLAQIVSQLVHGELKGQSFLAKGSKSIDFSSLLSLLENALGVKATLGGKPLDILGSPLSDNLFSEVLYPSCYRNTVQCIKNYQSPSGDYKDISQFNLKLKELEEEYKQGSLNPADYKVAKSRGLECGWKWMFG